MISDKQLEANRRNAHLSTGPRTEEGKRRASLNALRHGLTGQVTAMADQDRAAHDQFSQSLIQNLAPEGAMEIQLAQQIATDSWRLNRMSAIEENLFALGVNENPGINENSDEVEAALNQARVFTRESKQLQLLSLYEQRINRSLHKNLALLQSLQAARKIQREAQMKEAASLLKLTETRGMEYQPAQAAQAQVRCAANSSEDGFVFSNDEIRAAIDRDQRLQRAATMDFSRYRPRKLHAQAA